MFNHFVSNHTQKSPRRRIIPPLRPSEPAEMSTERSPLLPIHSDHSNNNNYNTNTPRVTRSPTSPRSPQVRWSIPPVEEVVPPPAPQRPLVRSLDLVDPLDE